MASSVNPVAGSSAANTAASSGSAGLGGTVPSEGVFLKLLVSQLQNQDPLNPSDSTTFITQLAQFSELEQVIAIRGDIETANAQQSGNSASASQTNIPTTNSQENS